MAPVNIASSNTAPSSIIGHGGGFSRMMSSAISESTMFAIRSVPGIGVLSNGAGLVSAMPIKDAPIRTMRPRELVARHPAVEQIDK